MVSLVYEGSHAARLLQDDGGNLSKTDFVIQRIGAKLFSIIRVTKSRRRQSSRPDVCRLKGHPGLSSGSASGLTIAGKLQCLSNAWRRTPELLKHEITRVHPRVVVGRARHPRILQPQGRCVRSCIPHPGCSCFSQDSKLGLDPWDVPRIARGERIAGGCAGFCS